MERTSAFLYRKLDNFTLDEYIIMSVVCSIFLSFGFPLLAIVGVLLYLRATGGVKGIIQAVSRSGFMIVFCLLTSAIAFTSGDLLGGVCSIGILLLMLPISYFRAVINKRLFGLLMDVCCIISLSCFGWAMMEYCRIIDRLNYNFPQPEVGNSSKDRINSTFFNANYHVIMTEPIVLICAYKIMQVKTLYRIIFYAVTIACNLFILYLSGSRTVWIPFVVTIPFMSLINKQLIYFITSMAGIDDAGMLLLLEPEPMQRATIFQDLAKCSNIWETAVKGIQAHPLLGKGPLAYFHIYKQYHGYPTQHVHSIYPDPILSHGIIGVILASTYFAGNLKEVYLLLKRRIDLRLFSLISVFILTILIHGILNYAVYWVRTGLLFLIVLSAFSMCFRKEQPYDIRKEH